MAIWAGFREPFLIALQVQYNNSGFMTNFKIIFLCITASARSSIDGRAYVLYKTPTANITEAADDCYHKYNGVIAEPLSVNLLAGFKSLLDVFCVGYAFLAPTTWQILIHHHNIRTCLIL
jgi:hypothetical protein